MTRSEAVLEKQLACVLLRLTATRDEEIARFTTGFKTGIPASYSRYGILRAKSKRKSKPRVGSSAGKYRRTRYYGFKKFNRDYDELERALLKLVQTGRANQRKLQKQLRAASAGVKVSARRGG